MGTVLYPIIAQKKSSEGWNNYTAEQEQSASDNCEKAYESGGSDAFNECRKKELKKYDRKDALNKALGFASDLFSSIKDRKSGGSSDYTLPSSDDDKKKISTLGWVGIGVGVIAVGVGIYFMVKK